MVCFDSLLGWTASLLHCWICYGLLCFSTSYAEQWAILPRLILLCILDFRRSRKTYWLIVWLESCPNFLSLFFVAPKNVCCVLRSCLSIFRLRTLNSNLLKVFIIECRVRATKLNHEFQFSLFNCHCIETRECSVRSVLPIFMTALKLTNCVTFLQFFFHSLFIHVFWFILFLHCWPLYIILFPSVFIFSVVHFGFAAHLWAEQAKSKQIDSGCDDSTLG